MNVKKKFISFSRSFCILCLCVVIGFAVSLQGFCLSTVKTVVSCTAVATPGTLTEGGYSATQQRSYAIKNIKSNYLDVDFWTHELNNIPKFDVDKTYKCSFKYDIVCNSATNFLNVNSCYVDVIFDEATDDKIRVYPSKYDHNDSYGYRLYFDFSINPGTYSLQFLNLHFSFSRNMSTLNTNHAISPLTFTIATGSDKVIEQFGSNYSKPNTSDIDKYNNAESQLYNGVESSLDNITSQWNNIGGSLLQYQGAFLSVGKFFNNLTNIGWVKVVLVLSVAIGMFALLLGAVLDYAKGTQIRNERENWKAETRKYRESMKNRRGRGK